MKVREQLSFPPDRLYRSTTMLVLGKPKSGKTRWASTVGRMSFDEPCPLLAIDQDNGTSAHKFVNPALIPESFKDYETLLDRVKLTVGQQDGPPYHMNFLGRDWYFNGLIVDTVNRTQDIIRRDIKGGYLSKKRIQIQDYGTMLDDVLGTLLTLKELAETKPFHLIITAQVAPDKITIKNAKEDDPGHYYWMPSLIGSVGPKLAEHFDNVLTTSYDPQNDRYLVFSKDTITPIGTFMGGLRFGEHCKPVNPPVVPSTWWEFLKMHQVDLACPEKIGQLDIPQHIDVHWSEVEANRQHVANTLAGKGVPIEHLFLACEAADWGEMSQFTGTGQDAVTAAQSYQPANTHTQDEDELRTPNGNDHV